MYMSNVVNSVTGYRPPGEPGRTSLVQGQLMAINNRDDAILAAIQGPPKIILQ